MDQRAWVEDEDDEREVIERARWVEEDDQPGVRRPPTYLPAIQAAAPHELEELYQRARRAGMAAQFAADVAACHHEQPDNLLFAAWFYRLQQAEPDEARVPLATYWRLVVPLSALLALVFWLVTAPRAGQLSGVGLFGLLWAPLAALFTIGFTALVARQRIERALLAGLALAGLAVYVLVAGRQLNAPQQAGYQQLMQMHLPLLAWGAVGVSLLGLGSASRERFAFLLKSLDAFMTAVLLLIAGAVCVIVTNQLFSALRITLSEPIERLLTAGASGLVPLIAVSIVYDPARSLVEQEFGRGTGRLVATLSRVLLPPAGLILTVYLCLIPFGSTESFRASDVLGLYVVAQFAVVALLVGATPLVGSAMAPRVQQALRLCLIVVAALAALVTLYALGATLYRFQPARLTMSNVAQIGWSAINASILGLVVWRLLTRRREAWVEALQSAARAGTVLYLLWAGALALALPWIF